MERHRAHPGTIAYLVGRGTVRFADRADIAVALRDLGPSRADWEQRGEGQDDGSPTRRCRRYGIVTARASRTRQPSPSSAHTSMMWDGTRIGVMVWAASLWVMKSIRPVVEKISGTPSSAWWTGSG